ncbi:MAG: hypothetical protein AAF652_03710 [Cyanobacteria bacterium P01_C01_bin.72]
MNSNNLWRSSIAVGINQTQVIASFPRASDRVNEEQYSIIGSDFTT